MEPYKVLIVEDDPASLCLLEYLVEVLSLEAVLASDVATARQALAANTPDIAILDVMLPDGDGIEILSDIRASHANVKVAMLTGTRDLAKLYRCHAWKPDAFFEKPLEANTVGEWLGQQIACLKLRACDCLL